ncbi:TonB-dependent siderophore receptor [Corallococcus sp. CA053C]|uniref:TonB-dependent receptor n=1 Tax=Corallococcus sp. CA053C TaxID=2316732 RepID=UPI001F1A36D8|nr:TonB-dependent siderophore receptor [Corallococcus sp. CA053C]
MRGALWPWGQAVGLASALAAGSAVAQETPPAADAPAPVQESRPVEEATPAVTPPAAPTPAPAAASSEAQPTEEQDVFVLPTVEVEGEASKYNATEPSITRLPKPLLDTPQTITVVPERVIEEQQATTLRDALRNVSGITVTVGEGGRQGDSFSLRGFSAQTDTLRDGVRDLGWYTRDTFNLEGVEVYFGPSSVVFGRGSTGGAINLVTKKPQKSSFQDLRLTAGTAPSGRLEADINQAINDTVQVRVSATGQLADVASRDVVQENRAGVSPSVRIVLSDKATLDLDYFYQREQSVPDYGHPYFNGAPVSTSLEVPRSAWYGVEGSDTERVNVHIGTGRFLYKFGGGSQLTNTLRYGGVDRFSRPTSPRGLTPVDVPTTIGRERYETSTDNTYLANQTDLRGVFQTGFLKHTANVGLELTREFRDQYRNNLRATGLPTGPNIPADLYEPDPHPDLSAVTPTFASSSKTRQWTVGAYAADQIELSRFFEVLASLRYDIFRTDYTAVNTALVSTRLENKDQLFNWRVGVVAHPLPKASLYAMYGTSSNPSAEVGTITSGQERLDPEKNQTFELGAKADLVAERLSVSGAVFQTDKKNARVANPDPTGPVTILDGAQRVKGFNASLAGTVLPRWNLFANYTFLDSEIRENPNAFLVGQALPNTPKHSVSLWTTYGVTDALSVGGGAVFQDVTAVNNPANETTVLNKVPNFWRFDAFARYAFSKVDVQLNVYNLTDTLYYDAYYSGQAAPAEGRSALLSAHVRF